jgi:hypothetical protein
VLATAQRAIGDAAIEHAQMIRAEDIGGHN